MTTQYTFTSLDKWTLSRLPWIHVSLVKGSCLNDPLSKRPGSKCFTLLPKRRSKSFTENAHFRNIVSIEQSTLVSKYMYAISVPDVIRIIGHPAEAGDLYLIHLRGDTHGEGRYFRL